MDCQKKTYRFYAHRLNISERTAIRKGKSLCHKLLEEKNKDSASVMIDGPAVLSHDQIDALLPDAVVKKKGACLLNESIDWLRIWTKTDKNDPKDHYKAQILVSLIRVLVGGK